MVAETLRVLSASPRLFHSHVCTHMSPRTEQNTFVLSYVTSKRHKSGSVCPLPRDDTEHRNDEEGQPSYLST